MYLIETRNKPRGALVRDGMPGPDGCVRVYQNFCYLRDRNFQFTFKNVGGIHFRRHKLNITIKFVISIETCHAI